VLAVADRSLVGHSPGFCRLLALDREQKARSVQKPYEGIVTLDRMARAIWKGSISFGLVEIPVALVAAEETSDLAFHQIDKRTFSRVGTKRINKDTGEDVAWEDIVRGYEYEPDEYVVLTDEELARANTKATQTIEIEDFVDEEEIDPVYFEKPYYLEPIKKGSKSYALLRETLTRTRKVGIARVVLRTRQRIAALFVREGVLVLELLRYAYELRDAKKMGIEVPDTRSGELELNDRELKMAERLVKGMSAPWNPRKYKDSYRDDVLAMVQRKIKSGHTHVIEVPDEDEAERVPRAEVVALMPLLKKSVESREKRSGSRERIEAREKTESRGKGASRDNIESRAKSPAKKTSSKAEPGRAPERSKTRRARSA
jgi:DNA end-binding protein Ku